MPPTRHPLARSLPIAGTLLALLALPAAAPVAAAPPELAFEPAAVVVSGLPPAGEVIVYGITREHLVYFWRLVPTREVLLADATGTARLEVPDGVGPRSIWAAVEPMTGELALASPEGFTPRELAFPAAGLGQSEAGAWRVLQIGFERVELLYVRPGVGAWWLFAADGATSDDDGAENSTLRVRFDRALPLWGAELPPAGLAPGDVVFAVSLDTLDFFAARLVEPGAKS